MIFSNLTSSLEFSNQRGVIQVCGWDYIWIFSNFPKRSIEYTKAVPMTIFDRVKLPINDIATFFSSVFCPILLVKKFGE